MILIPSRLVPLIWTDNAQFHQTPCNVVLSFSTAVDVASHDLYFSFAQLETLRRVLYMSARCQGLGSEGYQCNAL